MVDPYRSSLKKKTRLNQSPFWRLVKLRAAILFSYVPIASMIVPIVAIGTFIVASFLAQKASLETLKGSDARSKRHMEKVIRESRALDQKLAYAYKLKEKECSDKIAKIDIAFSKTLKETNRPACVENNKCKDIAIRMRSRSSVPGMPQPGWNESFNCPSKRHQIKPGVDGFMICTCKD